ncbi:MAG TPA: tRNA dihydrouridine synthase DusB [Mycobacteriales bacterium]|jgi:nifR3 family TIM-barrel protein|nr:tRNA dihydrouridine synthase DusB [Mycobacteriales bacterium]
MALKLGPIQVDPPVVLAPMAGVTNSAYRRLCARFGGGLYVCEMVSARGLVEGGAKTAGMVSFHPDEEIKSLQLYGVDPAVVGAAVTRVVEEFGVQHVDLNMGCPVPKVTRLGGGAALPVRVVLFERIVRAAVRAAGSVPVTVKVRKGVDDANLTYLDAGRAAQDAGAAAITLHARTAEEMYAGHADWAAITTLKESVDIPVLGNGDIWVAQDALDMLEQTGCDGVVIGRGCLGKPWLFRDLVDVFEGREPAGPPLLGEVMDVMREHARLLCEHRAEPDAMRDFRKHVGWYLTGYPVGGMARRGLAQVSSRTELDTRLGSLDPTLALPPGSERLARGHTHGPRPVSLPQGWLESRLDPTPPTGADILTSGG